MIRRASTGAWLACLLLIVGFAPQSLSAGALCVDPDDVACFSTIQAAVDAAVGSDIIEVRPRADGLPYRESVNVTTPNITIRGSQAVSFPIQDFDDLLAIDWMAERQLCPAVEVHACLTAGNPDACGVPFGGDNVFVVDALGITIEQLTISYGNSGVELSGNGHNAVVQNNCFIRNTRAWRLGEFDDHIANLTLRQNRVFSSNGDQNVYADSALVELNLIHLSEGLNIRGNLVTANLNAAWATTDQDGVELRGDNATITNNWVRAADSQGIFFSGDTALISNNRIEVVPARTGLKVQGFFVEPDQVPSENVTIIDNTIIGATRAGIELEANNSLVQNNEIVASGLDIRFEDDNSRAAGIWVAGSDNQMLNNTITQGGAAGILNGAHDQFAADNNVYDGNIINQNASSGILIWDGRRVVVTNNVISDSAGEGINNLTQAIGTRIEGNTVTGSRTDICNCGVIGSLLNNTFSTGGGDAACIVERGGAIDCNGKFGLLIDGFE